MPVTVVNARGMSEGYMVQSLERSQQEISEC